MSRPPTVRLESATDTLGPAFQLFNAFRREGWLRLVCQLSHKTYLFSVLEVQETSYR